jgi:pimeloyl-ACP methyl ester carboxylesterase
VTPARVPKMPSRSGRNLLRGLSDVLLRGTCVGTSLSYVGHSGGHSVGNSDCKRVSPDWAPFAQLNWFIVKRRYSSLKRLVLLVSVCLLSGLLAGMAYNTFQNWNLNRLHPVPGKIYEVNGSPMHMYCIGNGSPSIILESGLGNDWLIWQKVQSQIAKTNRVCSYDRAGIGWSAPTSESRGALTIADQLETLLREAGINEPLLLVGHSAGGLYARAFAGLFPNKVVGLVLVETSSPEAFHVLPSPALRKRLLAERHREAPWLFFKVATGLGRLSGDYCNRNTSQRIPAVQDLARAEDCRPTYMNSWLGEWDDFEPSAEQVAKLPCCASMPLLIISQDPGPPKPGSFRPKNGEETWDSVQEQLKHLSPRSMRIIARNSGHYVMVDRPDVVLAGIRIVTNELNGSAERIQTGQTVWR